MHINKWNAKRSGAAMTVCGIAEDGRKVTMTGVRRIETRGRQIVAVDRSRHLHVLHTIEEGPAKPAGRRPLLSLFGGHNRKSSH